MKQKLKQESNFRNFVCWLEDKRINHYQPDDRAGLRKICAGDWENHFLKYLNDLGCPVDSKEKILVINWLLSLAIRLEYGNKINKMKVTYGSGSSSCNPLENMDFTSEEFRAGVTSLGKMLNMPPHNDSLTLLRAICLLVKEKLSKDALERLKKQGIKQAASISLDKIDLGFETPDLITKEAGKILRLLYLKELRELQDCANEAIVAAQAITANPKTDSRLGKVGS
ncbi:hypothetical protein HELRODRAFT_161308 [Helobdella robusta]|uniref:RNA transcription, translation and transport factor protein n=1 Tax=Helobdella robusta TaxID=6412 RepID=T1ERB6_HELRO|nr:hypothetical protein HELRODRAFT_161308 [Helobdella robusta]ESO02079.1 hypothetical protein HELRODRAFT_161308 [Helobdella robusta]